MVWVKWAKGKNIAHNSKKANEEELREFRSRFGIPISDEDVAKAPFYRPPADSVEMKYLRQRREALGGLVPSRATEHPTMEVPHLASTRSFSPAATTSRCRRRWASCGCLTKLCRDKKIGKNIVPIVPDESRTFGMEGMFRQVGIYAHAGQLYEPVDSDQLLYYKEAQNGQILEEGITEAGSMASFIAAGTAYAQHGINMIPFFIYYSMFGFQRIGDLIWAAADMRAKGFLIGGTAGRTTLNGEGLQHQDGHSLLNAIAFPTVRAYDPAYAYETAVIVLDGMKRLYEDGETAIYYLTVENENYVMPPMPEGVEEGIIKGMYKLSSVAADETKPKVQLFGSGAILRSTLAAQQLLAEEFGISSDVWSVTSYTELRREAQCLSALEHAPPDPGAAPFVPRDRLRRRRRAVYRCVGLRAGFGRTNRPLGSRRTVRSGYRRHGAQRNARDACDATSKSTPSASPSPRCTGSKSKARFRPGWWRTPSGRGALTRKRSIHNMRNAG